uniref:Uncharacterized protein n=1 Tax=Anopheles melas TaxID=34690 RepID=A0A182U803_9DIPT
MKPAALSLNGFEKTAPLSLRALLRNELRRFSFPFDGPPVPDPPGPPPFPFAAEEAPPPPPPAPPVTTTPPGPPLLGPPVLLALPVAEASTAPPGAAPRMPPKLMKSFTKMMEELLLLAPFAISLLLSEMFGSMPYWISSSSSSYTHRMSGQVRTLTIMSITDCRMCWEVMLQSSPYCSSSRRMFLIKSKLARFWISQLSVKFSETVKMSTWSGVRLER